MTYLVCSPSDRVLYPQNVAQGLEQSWSSENIVWLAWIEEKSLVEDVPPPRKSPDPQTTSVELVPDTESRRTSQSSCVRPERLSTPAVLRGRFPALFFLVASLGRTRPTPSSCLLFYFLVVVVPSPGCVWLLVTPWTAALQASLSLTISQSLPKFTSIESVMPYNLLVLCCPLLLLPSIFPSIRVFSNELAGSNQAAKVLELQLQYQSFQWVFRVDFL